jgi:Ca2+-binding EF-hand superfamily protein
VEAGAPSGAGAPDDPSHDDSALRRTGLLPPLLRPGSETSAAGGGTTDTADSPGALSPATPNATAPPTATAPASAPAPATPNAANRNVPRIMITPNEGEYEPGYDHTKDKQDKQVKEKPTTVTFQATPTNANKVVPFNSSPFPTSPRAYAGTGAGTDAGQGVGSMVDTEMGAAVNTSGKEVLEKGQTMTGIFLFSSPAAYFKSVEAILLLQCFYIAMVFTQMVPVTHNAGWVFAFILPIPCVLYVLQLIMSKAVLLRAVYELNREVAAKVISDAAEEKVAIAKLRAAVFKHMRDDGIPEAEWNDFLKVFFFRYDKKNEGVCRADDLERILGDLGIFMTHANFKILWTAVDQDLSGGLDPDEVMDLFKGEVEDEESSPALKGLRFGLQSLLVKNNIPIKDWETYIRGVFNEYDQDGSGDIDPDEFFDMLNKLEIFVSDKDKPDVLKAVDKDGDNTVNFDEMWEIMFPSNQFDLTDFL